MCDKTDLDENQIRPKNVLEIVVGLFKENKFLIDTLKFGDNIYEGVCLLNGKMVHRKIQIK
jgi:hypothetical protein